MQQVTLLQETVYVLELLGTVAFALSGALAAIGKKTDIFGVLFIGITTAVGGGVFRDLLIGVIPPVAFRHIEYVAVAGGTALLLFAFAYRRGDRFHLRKSMIEKYNTLFDAIGLGAFTIIGMNAGIGAGYGDNGFFIIFLGLITGIGGGILRDTLIREIPQVLRRQVYAVASLTGGIIYYLVYLFGGNQVFGALFGIGAVVALRLASAKFRWHLPTVRLR